jgi:hypothetical protein
MKYCSEILGFRTLSIILVLKNKLRKNTTLRKLILFPSSGEGKKPILLGPLERASLHHSPEDGNRSSFRNVMFFLSLFFNTRMTKSENTISLKVIHHCQNPIVTNQILLFCHILDTHFESFMDYNLLHVFLLTYLRTELSPSWEAANCAAIQKIPNNFKEPEDSSLCSQEPSTGPYPKPVRSSPSLPILSLQDPS